MNKKAITSIENTRLFAGFSEAERNHILDTGRAETLTFSKEEIILQEGSRLNCFMILTEGRVQAAHYHEDGTLDLVELFLTGDLIGLAVVSSLSRRCPFSLCALEDCRLVSINHDALFSSHLQHGPVRKLRENMIHELARDNMKRLHKIDVLYHKSLRERICIFLRNRAALQEGRVVEIDMDREQFAQYLGVNRSSLSHELSQMRKDGLIDFHKGTFTILSNEVLR
jgi:CRP-like cAMP-binding protein